MLFEAHTLLVAHKLFAIPGYFAVPAHFEAKGTEVAEPIVDVGTVTAQ